MLCFCRDGRWTWLCSCSRARSTVRCKWDFPGTFPKTHRSCTYTLCDLLCLLPALLWRRTRWLLCDNALLDGLGDSIGSFLDIDGLHFLAALLTQPFAKRSRLLEYCSVLFGSVIYFATEALHFAFELALPIVVCVGVVLDLPVKPAKQLVGEEGDGDRIVAS